MHVTIVSVCLHSGILREISGSDTVTVCLSDLRRCSMKLTYVLPFKWSLQPRNRQDGLRVVHDVTLSSSLCEQYESADKHFYVFVLPLSLYPSTPSSSVIDQICQTLSAAAER